MSGCMFVVVVEGWCRSPRRLWPWPVAVRGSTGSGMNGRWRSVYGHIDRWWMMGGGAGYRFAHTTCSVLGLLPGAHPANVTLADMGMTRMMGGTAPLGAHMMLAGLRRPRPPGQHHLVRRTGWRTHELVILPLAGGIRRRPTRAGQRRKVAETGAWARPPTVAAAGLTASCGTVSWTTVPARSLVATS